MDEKTFLENYDKRLFDLPLVSVDAVLFTYHEQKLKVLLVKRSVHPEQGKWSLPGGFIDSALDKSIDDTALRKIKEKTGITPPYLEQLQSYGGAARDKRGWSVSVCYTAMMSQQACATNIATISEVDWIEFSRAESMRLAFDHRIMIRDARERLKQKALYSIVPAFALAEKFTLPELQSLHEVLIGKPLQKKSFRRRIEQAELLIDTGEKRSEGGRPAALYRMAKAAGSYTFLRNLEY